MTFFKLFMLMVFFSVFVGALASLTKSGAGAAVVGLIIFLPLVAIAATIFGVA